MKRSILVLCFLNAFFGFAQTPAYVPTNGLVGYWPFSGNATDQSSNANNGSVSGATLTTDRFGAANSAYNFNGTSDHIVVPDNSTLSGFNDMSISVWVNMSQFSGIQALVSKWFYALNCGSNSDTYALSLQNNSLVSATNNNNQTGYTAPQTFTTGDLNVWKHFVFVSNSTIGYHAIYINGVFTGSAAVSGTICATTNQLVFGAAIPTFRWFKGRLDDIGIWNRAITPCEISQLYSASIAPVVNATTSNTLICTGNNATLTANGTANTYLWNTGATTPAIVISPTVTSTYTVAATNTVTSCSNTVTVTQNVALCTGLQTIGLTDLVSVYPNPASTYLSLNFSPTTLKNFTVYIEDITGKQILAEKVTPENNEDHYKINTGNFENGIYILKITDASGNTIRREKLILSK